MGTGKRTRGNVVSNPIERIAAQSAMRIGRTITAGILYPPLAFAMFDRVEILATGETCEVCAIYRMMSGDAFYGVRNDSRYVVQGAYKASELKLAKRT
jgi:hypothetical protein